jgi:ethanolamine ammonia-lyase small subunit
MSAYVAYGARIGMQESERAVVSNIHRKGTPAVEAGAYLAELLVKILNSKASGISLKKEGA